MLHVPRGQRFGVLGPEEDAVDPGHSGHQNPHGHSLGSDSRRLGSSSALRLTDPQRAARWFRPGEPLREVRCGGRLLDVG